MYIQYSGPNAPRAPGPVARFFGAVLAAAVLVIAFFLGIVFLISAVIALTVIGGVLAYRARKYRPRDEAPGGGQVLEGEWHEVSRSGPGEGGPPRRD